VVVVVVVVPAVRMLPPLEAVTGMQVVMVVQVVAAVVVVVELELVGPTPQLRARPARLIVFVLWGCAARMQPARANSAQWGVCLPWWPEAVRGRLHDNNCYTATPQGGASSTEDAYSR
jgi:hypothetical protein